VRGAFAFALSHALLSDNPFSVNEASATLIPRSPQNVLVVAVADEGARETRGVGRAGDPSRNTRRGQSSSAAAGELDERLQSKTLQLRRPRRRQRLVVDYGPPRF
jgi:hypothetical protein